MALVVADVATRKMATEKAIGVNLTNLPRKLLLKRAKKLPKVKLKRNVENVNQEKNNQNQSQLKRKKSALLSLITKHKKLLNLKVSLRRLKFVERIKSMPRISKNLTSFILNKQLLFKRTSQLVRHTLWAEV